MGILSIEVLYEISQWHHATEEATSFKFSEIARG